MERIVRRWIHAWPIHLLLLALAVAGTYWHTLDVPFYLDDFSSIRDNELIYEWQGFDALRRFAPMRVVGYLTFAANYRWSHFDPRGYHLVNLFIHFLGGVAAYGFVRGLLRTPRLRHAATPFMRTWLPLLVAAMFLIHPMQTQAVTYVVQRLASLVALFYIASMAAFLQARLAGDRASCWTWAALCALSAGLALFTKENSATLPLTLVLLEILFFRLDAKGMLLRVASGFAGVGLVWTMAAIAMGRAPFSIESMAGLTTQGQEIPSGIPRITYLATQLPTLWGYLQHVVWPIGLHLDYGVPLRHFTDPMVLVALAGHLAMVALGLLMRKQPLVTFGILFYYLAHAIESSVIPIADLAFEHRAHLPNLGMFLVVSWLIVEGARHRRLGGARVILPGAMVVLIVLGWLTWQRNQLWRDPIGFWKDNTRLAPGKARPWGELGKYLVLANRPAEAETALRESLRLQAASGVPASPVEVVNLAMALSMQGRDSTTLALIASHIDRPMKRATRASLYSIRGSIEFQQHHFARAETLFRTALDLDPSSVDARANLASTLAQTGRVAAAESLFRAVLAIDPDNTNFRVYWLQARAVLLYEEGQAFSRARQSDRARERYRSSARMLEEVLQLDSTNALARSSLESLRRLAGTSPAQ